MTEKEIKKLNRYQLLELLILYMKRAEELQARLDETEKRLSDKDVQISSLGSIAEAALELNGVFKTAQDAADMYIDAAKKRAEEIEEKALKKSMEIIADATKAADRIKGES